MKKNSILFLLTLSTMFSVDAVKEGNRNPRRAFPERARSVRPVRSGMPLTTAQIVAQDLSSSTQQLALVQIVDSERAVEGSSTPLLRQGAADQELRASSEDIEQRLQEASERLQAEAGNELHRSNAMSPVPFPAHMPQETMRERMLRIANWRADQAAENGTNPHRLVRTYAIPRRFPAWMSRQEAFDYLLRINRLRAGQVVENGTNGNRLRRLNAMPPVMSHYNFAPLGTSAADQSSDDEGIDSPPTIRRHNIPNELTLNGAANADLNPPVNNTPPVITPLPPAAPAVIPVNPQQTATMHPHLHRFHPYLMPHYRRCFNCFGSGYSSGSRSS